ncbi:MAG: 3-oxoacyl-ACP synthase [Pleurocapsa minor GSE-CHR-MK-17-07R]|jgi:3-oxoacyl-[acyl-carrier-protein] synthase-3|nr:3-oxoacyl-ACP synthase [Pleurocapsa minor GSE-CHR-MK 17-07R]
MVSVGIAGFGTYFPSRIQTADELAVITGIPAAVLRDKMGIVQRHIADAHDTVTHMASVAAQAAIDQAGIDPLDIGLVISHGSEHKDHLVWNAAAKIMQSVGATNAYAFEMYALCAGAPIALNTARALMAADPRLRYVLLAAGSRENDLINFTNERSRFMFNFGSGGGALLLERDARRNQILGASAITDGTLSETVVLTQDAVAAGDAPVVGEVSGRLDVTDGAYMADRLGQVSLPNFVRVVQEAVQQSGAALSDVRFLGLTHMKKSFFYEILAALGLTPEQSVYLDHYGHVQSVDQVLALQLGLEQGKIAPGDLVVLAGAGTGYTWSAVALRWGE